MSVREALANLVSSLGGTPVAKTEKGLLKEIVVLCGGKGKSETVAELINEIAEAKKSVSTPAFGSEDE